MRQVISLSILGTLIALTCPNREALAVGPCQKCTCKAVKAWTPANSTNGLITGMRAPDPNEEGVYLAVDHSPTSVGFEPQYINSSTCGDPVPQKTGKNYRLYWYNAGSPECTGATDGSVEVTGWEKSTQILYSKSTADQRECQKAKEQ